MSVFEAVNDVWVTTAICSDLQLLVGKFYSDDKFLSDCFICDFLFLV